MQFLQCPACIHSAHVSVSTYTSSFADEWGCLRNHFEYFLIPPPLPLRILKLFLPLGTASEALFSGEKKNKLENAFVDFLLYLEAPWFQHYPITTGSKSSGMKSSLPNLTTSVKLKSFHMKTTEVGVNRIHQRMIF